MQFICSGMLAHCAARFRNMQAIVEFTPFRKKCNLGEVTAQFVLLHVNHPELLDAGRVDNPGIGEQFVQLGKRGGVLPFVVFARKCAGS